MAEINEFVKYGSGRQQVISPDTSGLNALATTNHSAVITGTSSVTPIALTDIADDLLIVPASGVTAAQSGNEDFVDADNLLLYVYASSGWSTVALPTASIRPGKHFYSTTSKNIYYYDPATSGMVLIASMTPEFATTADITAGTAGNLLISPYLLRYAYDHR